MEEETTVRQTRAIRPVRRFSIPLAGAMVLLTLDGPVFAHRPIFTEDKATGPETAIPIKDPRLSQVVYREITKDAAQVWLSFEAPKDLKVFVQIGVPAIDRLKGFRPAMAIVGPALPAKDPPFELPKGAGFKVLPTQDVAKPRFFHEPFTDTDSWILRSDTVSLPKPGRYYLVGYSPSRQTGKLWLSVGKTESFSLRDLLDFPTWRKKIREFHEVQEKPK
jgi:hypothetical protein